jgi:hypothetical protein
MYMTRLFSPKTNFICEIRPDLAHLGRPSASYQFFVARCSLETKQEKWKLRDCVMNEASADGQFCQSPRDNHYNELK